MYGVVATKLNARGWNRWGHMTKYFDYSDSDRDGVPTYEFGHRELSYGDIGADVKVLQEALISLGYSCGKWGADGEFGPATKSAVVAFQTANSLTADGIVGSKTVAAINALLPESGEEPETPADQETAKPQVKVTGGSVYLRTLPSSCGAIRAVVHQGDLLENAGEAVNGWFPVIRDGEVCYISGKYAETLKV